MCASECVYCSTRATFYNHSCVDSVSGPSGQWCSSEITTSGQNTEGTTPPSPLPKNKLKRQYIPDFGITSHFILRVMNIDCILYNRAIFVDFNFLGHPSNGKVVTVSIKLNTEKQEHKWGNIIRKKTEQSIFQTLYLY